MPSGVGGDRRITGLFLDDFAAGTRAIADYADMLDGLPDEELIRPTGFPPLNRKRPACRGEGQAGSRSSGRQAGG
jgi:hypothetical protein